MQTKDLQLKRAMRSVLFILLLCLAGITKMYAFDFSAVCETGQTLYYNITNATNHYVALTCPGTVGNDGWSGFTKPTGEIILPESVQNNGVTYTVTSIGNFAFFDCSGFIGSLTIPNSVTSIGDHAFYNCSGFTGSLTIPNSVTTIGADAFCYCIGFTGSLTISNSVTTIGADAFCYCIGFTGSLTISNSVTTIGAGTFFNCSGFTGSLTIPNSVTAIGIDAFRWCSGFTGSLTIPNSVTTIGDFAFDNCIGFTGSLTIPNSVTTIGHGAFYNCSGFTGSLTIPNSVTTIGAYAFHYCIGFTGSLTIPNSVTTIGDGAFYNCSGFTGSLTIPNSVTAIYADAFSGCFNLEAIQVGTGNIYFDSRDNCNAIIRTNTNELLLGCKNSFIPNSVTSIGDGAFSGCSGLTGSLIIPNSVTSIGNGAFSGCTGLTGNLTIPSSVTSIGKYAFGFCFGFTGDLVIPNSVTSIGFNPFVGCSELEHIEVEAGNTVYDSRDNCNAIINTSTNELITGCKNSIIPNTVTSVGSYAFYICTGLTSIDIPNSVISIGDYAFYDCTGLTSMTVLADNPPALGNDVFLDVSKDIPVFVPSGTIEAYQNADGWNEFTNYIEMEAPVLPADYVSDGLIMYLDGINNTRNGHSTTTNVWEDLMGNYDLAVTNYNSYTWENNHFIGLGNGGYLNTGHTWQYFNSLNDDITIEIVTYIDCDKTSPAWRGLAGWHGGSDGTHFQNDQGSGRMQTLGALPVIDADDQIATVSYTRYNGSFLNGSWKIDDDRIRLGINSGYTVVFGNSFAQSRGWNDSIYCIRMYNRSLTPEEVAYNHSIDVERFGAGNGGSTPIEDFVFHTYVDDSVFAMNTPIPIHGTVVNSQNAPVANVEVEIGIFVMGMKRTLQATTNENGVFSAIFEPLPTESGYYTVNSGMVGNNSTAVHDDFNIPGMAVVTEGYILCPVTQNQPKTESVRLRNKSNLPLSDIQVSIISAPEGCSISFMPLSLGGMETDDLVFTVNGTELTQGNQYQEIKLRATCNEGAETDFSIWYYCMEPQGILNVTPKNITSTMTKGQSKIIDVMLSNHGTAATGEITIDLPEVEWMSVVGSNTLPSLAVNDSAYFSLRLSPDDDIPLTQYTGNIAINSEHGEYANLPFNITAVSDSTGSLRVDVTDEYSYYTGKGPHLNHAEVTVKGYFSMETVAHGFTDTNGIFDVENLSEGYYRIHVSADNHDEYDGTILVDAGMMNQQEVFISYHAVTYGWIVVPGEIQDEYDFILNTTFETNVPAPVITIDAPDYIPDFEGSYNFNYTIINHGLIDAYDVVLHTPEDEDFLFTALFDNLDTIHALDTIVIPCEVTRLTNNTSICKHWVGSWVNYNYVSGPLTIYKNAHDYTLIGTEQCGVTPPSANGGNGGVPGFGGGGGSGSGSSSLYVHNIPVNTPSGSVNVQVGVQFNQQLVMTREAFFGTFSVHNGFDAESLESIGLNFTVKDEDDNDCTYLFQISTLSLDNITSIDGNGSLGAGLDGMAQIVFIPTKEAAPTVPKDYYFGGTFTFYDPYFANILVCDLYPVKLTVHPCPDLYIDYFMQRDIIGDDALTLDIVEPSVPAELGVIINNKGAGMAKNVILETAEPVIVENSQGLIIDFATYGMSFNGNEAQLGLTGIPFGNIESGHTAVAEWLFTSSLLGHFVSYEAHVIHNNSYDNPELSLISHLDIHELIHPIRAYGNLEDGINDFLVNDVPDEHNYPDSIYFSDGGKTGVSLFNNIIFNHYVTPQDTIVTLTVNPSRIGWNYGVTDDPGMNQYHIVSCIRNNDNQVIPLNNVWLTFVTIPDGSDPVYENKLHIVDTLSVDQPITYTLVYAGIPNSSHSPIGAIDGIFSVSSSQKVYFSQGNLQYQASTDIWRFADNQWDYVGEGNANSSSTYNGWIDLFGWGTSGWDNGNTYYHPWDISPDNEGTLFGPPGKHGLVGEYANADWGVYNPISNGGNQANLWRTLTNREWDYLLNTRATPSGVRYAKAQVNNVNGLILVPDNWDASVYELQNPNTSESPFESNVIGSSVWRNTFESHGAVFLPSAGMRFNGTNLYYLNAHGAYWSSTCHGSFDDYVINWGFSDEFLSYFAENRSTGASVRLVRDVVTQTIELSQGWNWISTYVGITLEDLKTSLVAAYPNAGINSLIIKSNGSGQTAWNPTAQQWIGGLNTMDLTQMYMIKVADASEIMLQGLPINPAEHPVTIANGNNWIAFPLGESMTVTDAFAGFPANGDVIKSNTGGQATWNSNANRWIGGLTTLEPGKGYIYNSKASGNKTFVFPTGAK